MNKKELTAQLAKKVGISQTKAGAIVDALFDAEGGILVGEILAGNKVTLPGFGTFGSKVRAGRPGTNPSTQVKISIEPKRYAYFRAGKTVRQKVAALGSAAEASA